MRRFKIFALFLLVFILMFVQVSFAQEEEGFIKRSFGRVRNLFKKRPAETPTSQPVPTPVPEAPEAKPVPEKVETAPPTEASKAVHVLEAPEIPEAEYTPGMAATTLAPGEPGGESFFGRTDLVEPEASPLYDYPEEDIIQRIKEEVKFWSAALAEVPELRVTVDEEGNIVKVEYQLEGVFTDIEELDKKTLITVHNKIYYAFSKILSNRLRAQWKATRLALSIPEPPPIPDTSQPPGPPLTHNPPPKPHIPSSPPKPTQTPYVHPPLPPSPPRR